MFIDTTHIFVDLEIKYGTVLIWKGSETTLVIMDNNTQDIHNQNYIINHIKFNKITITFKGPPGVCRQ